MISKIHIALLSFAKITGLNKLGVLKNLYFHFGEIQIPFFVKLQGVWMQNVLMRIYLKGAHEPGLTKCAREILKPGMTAIDLGAQYGYYTLIFAKLVGEGGRVIRLSRMEKISGRLKTALQKTAFAT